MRSVRCRGAPRRKSRGARVVVRRKGKLTGGACLSVAHGGERAWGKGVAGRAKQAGRASRASARVGARDRAATAGFGLDGVERWVGPARLAALPTRRRRSSTCARSGATSAAAPELAARVATAPAPAAARQSRRLNPQFPGRRRLASPPSAARVTSTLPPATARVASVRGSRPASPRRSRRPPAADAAVPDATDVATPSRARRPGAPHPVPPLLDLPPLCSCVPKGRKPRRPAGRGCGAARADPRAEHGGGAALAAGSGVAPTARVVAVERKPNALAHEDPGGRTPQVSHESIS
ncbi:hypothetical protein PVAP13_9NG255273 [Panicum virgatum]|uniref:Uncharacterized protein n=1 Tax=Panicum virgatum TaxID=38727 RepID=A0A8T0MPE4_PANVG|nr:hypothetical protein PVAP13_9NG255273 [Panicum virgatum]